MNTSKSKIFEFPRMVAEWTTYNSSRDKTNISENAFVQGSKNVYKKLSGNIANRPGQKRLGDANAVTSAVSSHFVWNTSWGATYTMTISDSKLWVIDNYIWYELLSGLTSTRYVFDKWYDTTEAKDRVLFVHGNPDTQWWSGGMATVLSTTSPVSGVAIGLLLNTGGAGYTANDILTVAGGTGATLKVTAVDGTGAVVSFIQLTGGSGYSFTLGATTTGGTGVGATVDIPAVVTGGTITKTNPSISWQQAGFNVSADRKIMIAGTEYTYFGGASTDTLFGVLPDPSAIPTNTLAIQSVITETNTPAMDFHNDFLKVINNQVYVGSYTSRLCYISSNIDFTDYVIPTPRIAGSPELLTLDATLNGISVRQGNAYISFGTDSWASITFSDVTVGTTLTQITKVDIKPVAINQAAYSHEMISTVGDNIIYLAKDQQVRAVGDFNNAYTPRYPSFSQALATELEQENFTGGSLSCVGEFIYLSAPATGNVYLRQERTTVDNAGNAVLEIIWHAPFVWNVTAVDSINGVVVGFSNANPQIYQLWNTGQWYDDSPSGDNLPYLCVLALGYRGEQRRQGLWSFDKLFTEGYITEGTPLLGTMNYDYEGSTNQIPFIVNDVTHPAYLFGTSSLQNVLGSNILGDELLGDEVEDSNETIPKFKAINSLPIINCFEWQPIYYSNAVNARWEILASASNAEVETEQNATFIINKRVI